MRIVVWVIIHCSMVGTCCLSLQANHFRRYTLRNSVLRVPQNGGGIIFIRIVKESTYRIIRCYPERKNTNLHRPENLKSYAEADISCSFTTHPKYLGISERYILKRRWWRVTCRITSQMIPKYFALLQCIFHLRKKGWIQIAHATFGRFSTCETSWICTDWFSSHDFTPPPC
jgi:hypothetical protein